MGSRQGTVDSWSVNLYPFPTVLGDGKPIFRIPSLSAQDFINAGKALLLAWDASPTNRPYLLKQMLRVEERANRK